MQNDLSDKIDLLAHDVAALRNEKLSEKIEELKKLATSSKEAADSANGNLFWVVIFIGFFIALTSNPNREAHLSNLAARAPGDSPGAQAFKDAVVKAESYVFKADFLEYESYWCCSVLRFKNGDIRFPLSFGIFGNVFDYGTMKDIESKFETK